MGDPIPDSSYYKQFSGKIILKPFNNENSKCVQRLL